MRIKHILQKNVDCITDSTYNLDDTDQSFIIKDEEELCGEFQLV